eukprot:scaffold51241_cov64-Phaeocystis_antarctica.AAC.2
MRKSAAQYDGSFKPSSAKNFRRIGGSSNPRRPDAKAVTMTNRCPTAADAQLSGLAYLYTTPRRSAAPRCRVERPRLSQPMIRFAVARSQVRGQCSFAAV